MGEVIKFERVKLLHQLRASRQTAALEARIDDLVRRLEDTDSPDTFAEMPEAKAKHINTRGLAAAQERLLRAGAIWNEPLGPKSRDSRRVARKPIEHREAAE